MFEVKVIESSVLFASEIWATYAATLCGCLLNFGILESLALTMFDSLTALNSQVLHQLPETHLDCSIPPAAGMKCIILGCVELVKHETALSSAEDARPGWNIIYHME